VSLYTAGNAFILGLLASNAAVGYYSAAEKIVKAVLGLTGPITQATFPRFSKMVVESKDSVFKWGQKDAPNDGHAGTCFISILCLFVHL